jgi:hypothetical protein
MLLLTMTQTSQNLAKKFFTKIEEKNKRIYRKNTGGGHALKFLH